MKDDSDVMYLNARAYGIYYVLLRVNKIYIINFRYNAADRSEIESFNKLSKQDDVINNKNKEDLIIGLSSLRSYKRKRGACDRGDILYSIPKRAKLDN